MKITMKRIDNYIKICSKKGEVISRKEAARILHHKSMHLELSADVKRLLEG